MSTCDRCSRLHRWTGRRRRIASAGALTTVALAAAPSAWGAVKNPCALVTQGDATKVFGAPSGPGTPVKTSTRTGCYYKHGTEVLSVSVRAVSRSLFVAEAKADPGPVVPVQGFGSVAYSIAVGTTLLVWTHGTELAVELSGATTARPVNPLKIDEMLARKALRRL